MGVEIPVVVEREGKGLQAISQIAKRYHKIFVLSVDVALVVAGGTHPAYEREMTAEQLSEAEFDLRVNSLIQDPHVAHPVLHVLPVGQSGGGCDVDKGRVHVVARHVEIGCPYRQHLRVRRNGFFHDDVERVFVSEVIYVRHRIRMID